GVVVTLVDGGIVSWTAILIGAAIGGVIGLWMARSVAMTAMPQLVALLNGFGGAASFLVGTAELLQLRSTGQPVPASTGVTIQLSILIGALTLTGSVVAWAKLQEVMTGRPVVFPLQKTVNAALFAGIAALGTWMVVTPAAPAAVVVTMIVLSLLIGVLLVLPIGGADMPVVISLLNSYSGMAVATTGFVIDNPLLIISGALVGSSGLILTQIMCKAMNRSLGNVLFGAFGATVAAGRKSSEGLTARSVSAEDAAVQLAWARNVVVVPGYGMAVAQAQHAVRELAELIEKNGGTVRYAIHPVAGRMPGHMNVLLAEANIPYDRLYDMDAINDQFDEVDVALVIGANDVVNPAARSDPSSPIYGMPILNVDRARSVIVLKRGMNPGFAGIENELFFHPRHALRRRQGVHHRPGGRDQGALTGPRCGVSTAPGVLLMWTAGP
ncbi:MAG TPA: NAD(P)(+) transhydrogenase (Re/Si-specific) subunit beta, partial [Gemmatimonadales bacterium]|nr:NAD(P)(+) transhydrogenase (Re/Si-specific) subunit beta [Gemmatimonadales bacterium]